MKYLGIALPLLAWVMALLAQAFFATTEHWLVPRGLKI